MNTNSYLDFLKRFKPKYVNCDKYGSPMVKRGFLYKKFVQTLKTPPLVLADEYLRPTPDPDVPLHASYNFRMYRWYLIYRGEKLMIVDGQDYLENIFEPHRTLGYYVTGEASVSPYETFLLKHSKEKVTIEIYNEWFLQSGLPELISKDPPVYVNPVSYYKNIFK